MWWLLIPILPCFLLGYWLGYRRGQNELANDLLVMQEIQEQQENRRNLLGDDS